MRTAAVPAAMIAAALAMSPATAAGSPQSDLDNASAAATQASATYDEAASRQAEAQRNLDEAAARAEQLQSELPAKQQLASKAVRDMYVERGDFAGVIDAVFSCDSLPEVLGAIESFSRISEWREREYARAVSARREAEEARAELEGAKAEADSKVAEASAAKQAALDAQEAARAAMAASQARQPSSTSSSGAYAATSSSWGDEASAKAYIIGKESGGNYSARNGRYYGAYQLTESYLGGDYSPENQDRVAQEYVEGRYGSWTGAAAFWDSHGWY